MGSGSSKSHEAFSITPASPPAPLPPDDTDVDNPDVDVVETPTAATTDIGDLEQQLAAAGDGDGVELEVDDIQLDEDPLPLEEEDEEDLASIESVDASAEVAELWDGERVLTPLPETLKVGDGIGVAVAVGGADFVDGSATLISYQHPGGDGAHEVLSCTLTEDAEQKVLDALIPPTAPMVPVEVETTVTGRLPVDEANQLHEQLAKVAKSINHHQADGTPIPDHTHANLASVTAKLNELAAAAPPESTEAAMVAKYLADAAACAERCDPGYSTPYTAGGKIPMINPFEHTGPATITQMVPDPNFIGDGLNTASRPASRIGADLVDGVAVWNGNNRRKANGTELVIDLGDGFTAVVRPTSMNPAGKCDYSLRNTLEIIAPAGSGNQHELVAQLAKLNLVNRPMNRSEAEWAYLQRNVYAHSLEGHPAVSAAIQQTAGLEDAHEQTLLVQRAHQAIGLDDAGLARFARKLRLDAEANALADKVKIVREGVAQALGAKDGAALAASPGYTPVPTQTGGWLTWNRIGQTPETLAATFDGKAIVHHVTGHNLADMLRSGVFASTERRRMMGITKSHGMSESADQGTGGAKSVFLRMRSKNAVKGGPQLVWDDPGRLLARTDWYAYNGDHFGAVTSATGHSTHGQIRDPKKAATGLTASNNEIMISHGLDLLGADAPTRIICSSAQERSTILSQLATAGITTLGGKPLDKVIVT